MKKMRLSLALFLAAMTLCVSLCSCELPAIRLDYDPLSSDRGIPGAAKQTYLKVDAPDYTVSPYYKPVSSRYSYDSLGEDEKALYDALLENIFSISARPDNYAYPTEQVILDGVLLGDAAIAVAVNALCKDNPYLFWTAQTYTSVRNDFEKYTAVQLYSEFSYQEITEMMTELDDVLSSVFASVPEELDPYEREKFVHDYVIARCIYDTDDVDRTLLNAENLKSHSVYGALVERLCVCEGYGTAMQLLMNGLGVDCVTLTGEAYNGAAKESEDKKELHLWNAVKLGDGRWYHVDPTWDDQEHELLRYSYFNLSDDLFLNDHTLSGTPAEIGEEAIVKQGTQGMNLFIPVCDSMTYNYYAYSCPALTEYDPHMLENSLYSAAKSGEGFYIFYVVPSLDYQEAVNALFTEYPQAFFRLIDRVNDRLGESEIDKSNVIYYLDEMSRGVAVELNYL